MTATAASDVQKDNAELLFDLNVLTGSAGTLQSVFKELDNKTKRDQTATIVCRLMGGEDAAIAQNAKNPFTDAQGWQKPYISWLYNQGLANGVSSTKFGSANNMTFQAYCAFMLRCLGYSEKKGDFAYKDTVEFFAGIVYGDYYPIDPNDRDAIEMADHLNKTVADTEKFWSLDPKKQQQQITRGDMANITVLTLFADMKGKTDYYLIDYLYDIGAIELAEAAEIKALVK